jgi:hypothetical protein
LQPSRDLLQKCVAGRMSQEVIDQLEAVQVHVEQTDRMPVAAGYGNGLLEAILKEDAVGDSGERVVVRPVRQFIDEAPVLHGDAGQAARQVQELEVRGGRPPRRREVYGEVPEQFAAAGGDGDRPAHSRLVQGAGPVAAVPVPEPRDFSYRDASPMPSRRGRKLVEGARAVFGKAVGRHRLQAPIPQQRNRAQHLRVLALDHARQSREYALERLVLRDHLHNPPAISFSARCAPPPGGRQEFFQGQHLVCSTPRSQTPIGRQQNGGFGRRVCRVNTPREPSLPQDLFSNGHHGP